MSSNIEQQKIRMTEPVKAHFMSEEEVKGVIMTGYDYNTELYKAKHNLDKLEKMLTTLDDIKDEDMFNSLKLLRLLVLQEIDHTNNIKHFEF